MQRRNGVVSRKQIWKVVTWALRAGLTCCIMKKSLQVESFPSLPISRLRTLKYTTFTPETSVSLSVCCNAGSREPGGLWLAVRRLTQNRWGSLWNTKIPACATSQIEIHSAGLVLSTGSSPSTSRKFSEGLSKYISLRITWSTLWGSEPWLQLSLFPTIPNSQTGMVGAVDHTAHTPYGIKLARPLISQMWRHGQKMTKQLA